MAVGDLSSSEPGTGARDNGGKPPYKYIPARILAQIIDAHDRMCASDELDTALGPDQELLLENQDEVRMLEYLGKWEEGASWIQLQKAAGVYLWTPELLDEVARVFEFGAKKYDDWNWTKGMPWSIPLECIKRHVVAICLNHQWKDRESGFSHAAHIGCNLIMLLWYSEHYLDGDNRPKELRNVCR